MQQLAFVYICYLYLDALRLDARIKIVTKTALKKPGYAAWTAITWLQNHFLGSDKMDIEDLRQVQADVTAAAEELINIAQPKPGQIFVVGCSTSEVQGSKIGSAGSPEIAQALMDALIAVTAKHKLYLAQQCCEHLNRALVVEEESHGKIQPDPGDGASRTPCRRLHGQCCL